MAVSKRLREQGGKGVECSRVRLVWGAVRLPASCRFFQEPCLSVILYWNTQWKVSSPSLVNLQTSSVTQAVAGRDAGHAVFTSSRRAHGAPSGTRQSQRESEARSSRAQCPSARRHLHAHIPIRIAAMRTPRSPAVAKRLVDSLKRPYRVSHNNGSRQQLAVVRRKRHATSRRPHPRVVRNIGPNGRTRAL